jgi:hypothetical protein
MTSIVLRLVLLAGGMALAELGLDSAARGSGIAVAELGVALLLLVAGTAGFIVPLLSRGGPEEVNPRV